MRLLLLLLEDLVEMQRALEQEMKTRTASLRLHMREEEAAAKAILFGTSPVATSDLASDSSTKSTEASEDDKENKPKSAPRHSNDGKKTDKKESHAKGSNRLRLNTVSYWTQKVDTERKRLRRAKAHFEVRLL